MSTTEDFENYIKKDDPKEVDPDFNFSGDFSIDSVLASADVMQNEEKAELFDIDDFNPSINLNEPEESFEVELTKEESFDEISKLLNEKESKFSSFDDLVDIEDENRFNVKSKREHKEEEENYRIFVREINENFFNLKSEENLKLHEVPEKTVKILESYGYNICKKTVRYGESQFEAVSESVYGAPFHAKNIRFEVCVWLKDHANFISSDGRTLTFLTSLKWLEYCKLMTKYYYTEGDSITLNAISEIFDVKITLFDCRFGNEGEIVKEVFGEKKTGKKVFIMCWSEGNKTFFTNLKLWTRYAIIIENNIPGVNVTREIKSDVVELANLLSEELHFNCRTFENLSEEDLRGKIVEFVKFFHDKRNIPIEMVMFMFVGVGYNKNMRNYIVPFEEHKEIEQLGEKKYEPSSYLLLENVFELFNKYVSDKIPKLFLFDSNKNVNNQSCLGVVEPVHLPENSIFLSSTDPNCFSSNPFVPGVLKSFRDCANMNLLKIVENIEKLGTVENEQSPCVVFKKSFIERENKILKGCVLKKVDKIENFQITNFITMKEFLCVKYLDDVDRNVQSISQDMFFSKYKNVKKDMDATKIYKRDLKNIRNLKKYHMKIFYETEKSLVGFVFSKLLNRNQKKLKKISGNIDVNLMKKKFNEILSKKMESQFSSFQSDCVSKFKNSIVTNLENKIKKNLKLHEEMIEFKSFQFEVLKENISFNKKEKDNKLLLKNVIYFTKIIEKEHEKKNEKEEMINMNYVKKEMKIYLNLLENFFKSVLRVIRNQFLVEMNASTTIQGKKDVVEDYESLKDILGGKLEERKSHYRKVYDIIGTNENLVQKKHHLIKNLCQNKENKNTFMKFSKFLGKTDLKTSNEKQFTEIIKESFDVHSKIKKLEEDHKEILIEKKEDEEKAKFNWTFMKKELKKKGIFDELKVKMNISPKFVRSMTNPNLLVKNYQKKFTSPKKYGKKSSKVGKKSSKKKKLGKRKLILSKTTRIKSVKKPLRKFRKVAKTKTGRRKTKRNKRKKLIEVENLEKEVSKLMKDLNF